MDMISFPAKVGSKGDKASPIKPFALCLWWPRLQFKKALCFSLKPTLLTRKRAFKSWWIRVRSATLLNDLWKTSALAESFLRNLKSEKQKEDLQKGRKPGLRCLSTLKASTMQSGDTSILTNPAPSSLLDVKSRYEECLKNQGIRNSFSTKFVHSHIC